MKSILILLITWLPTSFLFATGLLGDVITIDGKKWEMMEKPFNRDSTILRTLMNYLPKERNWSTANWGGYIGHWVLADDHLYLQNIEIEIYNEKENRYDIKVYPADSLKNLYPLYYEEKGICPRWFSGEIRAGRGKLIRYEHAGFDRNREEEYVFQIRNGRVESKQCYHNYKKQEGLKLRYAYNEISKRFPFNKFPELDTEMSLLFISNFKVSPDGHLQDCEVAVSIWDNFLPTEEVFARCRDSLLLDRELPREFTDHFPTREDPSDPMIKTFKKILKEIYPWEVFYLNGAYIHEEQRQTFSFSIPTLLAHTPSDSLETGVPVCYLTQRGDTIIPLGRYCYAGSDTIRPVGVVLREGNKQEYVAINNQGEELCKPFVSDNGPDTPSEGLFRIINDDGRIGYADRWGKILIPPQYKAAFPFKKGRALVTFSGKSIEEGEHSFWETPEWVMINRQGTVLLKCRYLNRRNIKKGIAISLFDSTGQMLQTLRYQYPAPDRLPRHFIPDIDWVDINADNKEELVIYPDPADKTVYDCFGWDEKQKKYTARPLRSPTKKE